MLRLYLFFLRDAVKVVAGSAAVILVFIAVLARLGIPPSLAVWMMWPLALVGFMFLPRRYVGRNLGWILGLPYRKLSLAWFNFGLNLSILVLVCAAYGLVAIASMATLSDASTRIDAAHHSCSLSFPHGLALAALLFAATTVPMVCWGVMVQMDAQERARRRRAALVRVLLFAATPVVVFGAIAHHGSISPLLLFAAFTALFCILIPGATAKALGTSIRQRRTWMLAGALIATVETLGLLAVSLADLQSRRASVREEAALLLGCDHSPISVDGP
jgi:hypothetical protein